LSDLKILLKIKKLKRKQLNDIFENKNIVENEKL
jgi:hypothetical protein